MPLYTAVCFDCGFYASSTVSQAEANAQLDAHVCTNKQADDE